MAAKFSIFSSWGFFSALLRSGLFCIFVAVVLFWFFLLIIPRGERGGLIRHLKVS